MTKLQDSYLYEGIPLKRCTGSGHSLDSKETDILRSDNCKHMKHVVLGDCSCRSLFI